jgi:3-methyladenine DNA glycosylase AlkD
MNMNWTVERIMSELKSRANAENVDGMVRFGINPNGTLGISIYVLRDYAKQIGTNHALALELWDTGLHETHLLASYIDDPKQVTEVQMETWVMDFDSWDVCDQVCSLFEESPFAYQKVFEWSTRPEKFVKRAAFAILAGLAVHDKNATDDRFEQFFTIIESQAIDDRNFVKKSVNWSLRNIGKRNRRLNARAVVCAHRIAHIDSRSAHWIAADALRELTAKRTLARLKD